MREDSEVLAILMGLGRRLIGRRFGRPARPPTARAQAGGLLARVRAALAGTVRVRPGVSLTAPTGEAWDAEKS